MRLYGTPGWGSAIVEAMLALVGEPYDFVDVEGFDRPGEAHDRLAAVNPLRQVPTLVLDDGEVRQWGERRGPPPIATALANDVCSYEQPWIGRRQHFGDRPVTRSHEHYHAVWRSRSRIVTRFSHSLSTHVSFFN